MSGLRTRVTVVVAVDPFLVRSALHAALVADSRLDARLCPLGEDALSLTLASGAQMVVVSRPLAASELCVVLLSPVDQTARITYGTWCQRLDYDDMASLCDLLGQQAPLFAAGNVAS